MIDKKKIDLVVSPETMGICQDGIVEKTHSRSNSVNPLLQPIPSVEKEMNCEADIQKNFEENIRKKFSGYDPYNSPYSVENYKSSQNMW